MAQTATPHANPSATEHTALSAVDSVMWIFMLLRDGERTQQTECDRV